MTLDGWYLAAATVGAVLFVVRLVLAALGVDHDHELAGTTGAEPLLDRAGFQLLSLHALSAFLTIFGLVGLAMRHESQASALAALAAASAAGVATVWLLRLLLRGARRLEASGTFELRRAIGATGTIYLGVAPGKPGKVTLHVHGRMLQLEAVSADETLATGSAVLVTDVHDDGSVEVTRAL